MRSSLFSASSSKLSRISSCPRKLSRYNFSCLSVAFLISRGPGITHLVDRKPSQKGRFLRGCRRHLRDSSIGSIIASIASGRTADVLSKPPGFRAQNRRAEILQTVRKLRDTFSAASFSRPTTAQSGKNRENRFPARPYGASHRVFA